MANDEHREMLKRNVDIWNRWRATCPDIKPDLSEVVLIGKSLRNANLRNTDLSRANLVVTTLSGADLSDAKLFDANLGEACLTGANLSRADCRRASFNGTSLASANLSGADLSYAELKWASLFRTDLSNANLTYTNLEAAQLIHTKLENATLDGCFVYGVSVWELQGKPRTQSSLCITPKGGETLITVDDLEVAQFIHLLLNNERIRQIIDAVTSKVVLILGRFTEERKTVLEAIRKELPRWNFTPILFDFDKPASKDVTGTVETLARMARFIIADITDPSSIPHELATIVPFLRTTPVLPIKLVGSKGYSMFDDMRAYPWVLKTHEYSDSGSLIAALSEVIKPADSMAEKLHNLP
jgi:uncharacterized protein YjbI with pentapeptide repeats